MFLVVAVIMILIFSFAAFAALDLGPAHDTLDNHGEERDSRGNNEADAGDEVGEAVELAHLVLALVLGGAVLDRPESVEGVLRAQTRARETLLYSFCVSNKAV